MGKRSMRVSPENLRAASQAILVKLGMGDKSAQAAAKVLVATDLRGIDSHGVGGPFGQPPLG